MVLGVKVSEASTHLIRQYKMDKQTQSILAQQFFNFLNFILTLVIFALCKLNQR